MKKSLLIFSLATMMVASGCAKKPAQTAKPETSTTETAVTNDVKASPVVKTIDQNVHGTDILKTIADNYKGKVVLFDFWATWCPPCRRAMTQVDEIKPELTEKGCVFVYITGETSPLETWQTMIKNIDGEHYRLTEKQWGELCKSLNIPGIPAYLLLNKDGSTAYDNLSQGGYPGNETLQNQILVALTK